MVPAFNVGIPQMNPIAPIPLMQIPFNNQFLQQNRYVPPQIRNTPSQPKDQAPSKPNDSNNSISKTNKNQVVKNNNNNNVAKNTKTNNNGKNKANDKQSSPFPEAAKQQSPASSSKLNVSNNPLKKETNDIKDKLALLKMRGSKTENNSDDDDVDAGTLAFLKSAAEDNRDRKASILSRSSSTKSICSVQLKGTVSFPESNSICLIVAGSLIRSSVFIRSLSETALKEYNEIVDIINERGKLCEPLKTYPKEGEQVVYFKDGIFCRAYVVNVVENVMINDKEIDLHLIDTGEQELSVKLCDLKSSPPEFKKLKRYVFLAKLRNCSGTFGQSAQKYINGLIEDTVQMRLQYNGVNSQKQIINDVVCDFYHNATNQHVNEHLKSLQEKDDC